MRSISPQGAKSVDSFRLVLSPHAAKDLDALSDTVFKRIAKAMRVLEENPFPRGKLVKKLKGKKSNFYRLRAEKYRVFYTIKGEQVVVLRVLGKKDAGRYIQGLS